MPRQDISAHRPTEANELLVDGDDRPGLRGWDSILERLQALPVLSGSLVELHRSLPSTHHGTLLELEDRYAISSTIITSQLKGDDWHAQIGDETIADAICDRLVHNAHRIKLAGESVWKTKALTNGKDKGKAK